MSWNPAANPARNSSKWAPALRALAAGAGVVLLSVAFGAGLALASLNGAVRDRVIEAKAGLRQALDLPKTWNANAHLDPADRTPVACPDPRAALVLVTGGQSNAANTLPTPLPPQPGVFTFFDGACYATQDPVLGATGTGGSLWTQLGGALEAATGRPVVLVHGAVGGSTYADWLDPRSGYLDRLLRRVADLREAGFEPDWILWHQGETDAAARVVEVAALGGEIAALGRRLLDAAPEARLYLFQTSRCVGAIRAEGRPEVLAAQAAAVAALPRSELGMDTDALGPEHRFDGCHFNARGRDAIVEELVPALSTGSLREEAAAL